MHVIETKGYNAADKRTIARQFLIPEVRGTIGFSETDVTIEDDVLDHITQSYTSDEKGVRNLKRCLENIYAKLNVSRLAGAKSTVMKSSDMIPFQVPFAVTRDVVDNLLKPPTRDVPAQMYV
jgi:ATP-dependent Lon protease